MTETSNYTSTLIISCIERLFFIVIISFALSCSSTKPFYGDKVAAKDHPLKSSRLKGDRLFFADGNIADSYRNFDAVLKKLNAIEKLSDKNSIQLFLSGFLDRSGMPEEESIEAFDQVEKRLPIALNRVNKMPGKSYVCPGENEWKAGKKGGLQSVSDWSEYVDDLDLDRVRVPLKEGCPGPEEVEIGEHLVLLIIDSQWWLQDWVKEYGINDDCELHKRSDLLVQLEEALNRNHDKAVVIVAHHPIFSNGNHDGKFSAKDHFFPLSRINDKIKIPLPIIGSIYPAFVKASGRRADLAHVGYKSYRKSILRALEGRKNIVYMSSHEAGMQHFEHADNHFVTVGTLDGAGYIRKGRGADFSYSQSGFSSLVLNEAGEMQLEMYAFEQDQAELIYSQQLFKSSAESVPSKEEENAQYPVPQDAFVTAKASEIYESGKFRRFWMGNHYREIWSTTVSAPTLNLNTEKGGLTPLKRGGGQQTRSLRMSDSEGRHFVIRSIEKFAEGALPPELRNTFAKSVIQDQISASHPYAAFVIPRLADAAGVFHTNPKLVYVPRQERLGKYNEALGDALYLFEERPDGNRKDVAGFGRSKNIVSTPKAIKNTKKHQDHLIDQQAVLRARLFDILIGDWDRHDDQWRWATFEEDGKIMYRPIPRDRDQAFFKFDGAIPYLITRKWVSPYIKFQNFGHEITSVKGLGFNARYFDRAFLTEPELEDWLTMSREIQQNLTDEVIDKAIAQWPDSIYAKTGEIVAAKLKSRRDDLLEYAEEYYRFLSKYVTIVASKDDDLIFVQRLDQGGTKVEHFEVNENGEQGGLLYSRTFSKKETKEIRIFGLKGDDIFHLCGNTKKGSRIRVIGGSGQDKIVDESHVSGLRKMTKYYDERGDNSIEKGRETHDLTRKSPDINAYDRYEFNYNLQRPVISIGYNPDDGIFLGGGFNIIRQRFRKSPYGMRHSFSGNAALSTKGFNFTYEADLIEAIRKFDFNLDFKFFGPNYVTNFYGMGNESRILTDDKDFHRLRIRQGIVAPTFRRTINQRHALSFGPLYTFSKVEKTADRFISSDASGLSDADFENKNYLGAHVKYAFERLDNQVAPQRGLSFFADGSWQANLDQVELNFGSIHSELSLFYTFDWFTSFTIATRTGGATNIGEFEFFQSHVLGGKHYLRGHSTGRFYGESMFYSNKELRIKLVDVKTIVFPFAVGIFGLADHGRVWLEGENSSAWHRGYGGGIWLSPLDLLAISGSYTVARDENRVNVNFRMFF